MPHCPITKFHFSNARPTNTEAIMSQFTAVNQRNNVSTVTLTDVTHHLKYLSR